MFSTLKWKMVFWYTTFFSIILGFGLISAYKLVKNIHLNRSVESLRQNVLQFLRMPGVMRNFALPPGVAIIDENGNLIAGSINTEHENFDHFLSRVFSVKNPAYIKLGEDEYLVFKAKFVVLNKERDYYLLSPAGGMGDFLRILARSFFMLWVIFSVFSFVLGNYFVNKSLTPMRRITDELKDINAADLARRVHDPETNDEVSKLAKTINEMLDRLQVGFEAQNDFINDVSHELKTPLATIQGYAELMQKFSYNKEIVIESARTIQDTSIKLAKLVETLLSLSKPVTRVEFQNIELNTFLHNLAEQFRLQFKEFSIYVEGQGCGYADPRVLEIIVKALVENAVKFSKDRKEIILKCGDGWVSVKDFGIGMSEFEKNKIFHKFYKGDKSRSSEGYGLGLSLVEKLAKTMNCKIEVESELNKGSEFIVKMPPCN